jgi:integrase/recombinase XerD
MSNTALIPAQASTDTALIDLWLAGRPATTAAAYRHDATRFLAFAGKPLVEVTVGDIHAHAAHLAGQGVRPASQRRPIAAIKSLLAFGVQVGYLRYNVGSVVKLRRAKDTLSERILSEADIHRIISLEPDTRNAALLRLLYATGGRVSEICGLTWRDVVWRDGEACQVTLYGKGDKTRAVWLPSPIARDLRRLKQDAAPDAPVFRSRKGGKLTTVQVWRVVKAAAARARIEASPSPHWFRHAHVSHALDRGAPANLVQTTVGHASLDTTTGYSHVRPNESSAKYLAL